MSVVHWVVLIQHRIIELIILVDDDGDLSVGCERQLNAMSRGRAFTLHRRILYSC